MEIKMTWFNNLKMELDLIESTELIEPDQAVESDWTIVGELPGDMKRVWTAYKNYARAAAEAQVDVNFCHADQRQEKIARFQELVHKAGALNKLLWIAINDYFHLWEKPQTGLRVGWKVIYSDDQPPAPQFPGFQIG